MPSDLSDEYIRTQTARLIWYLKLADVDATVTAVEEKGIWRLEIVLKSNPINLALPSRWGRLKVQIIDKQPPPPPSSPNPGTVPVIG